MKTLSWFGIFRLGLVQTALGAIVVLTTSTMNRVMVVELALPAMLPGALVGFHYAVQMSRPRWGYDSDMGGRRTPWIIGGIAVLGVGGVSAALATALMGQNTVAGILLAIAAYALIGVGVGAAGTSLLALLAARTEPGRRAGAASMVWLMMIAGFVVTAATVGSLLDPFTPMRLVGLTSVVALVAFTITVVAIWGVESRASTPAASQSAAEDKPGFWTVFSEVWSDSRARAFTIFVFTSMLAYSTQDLILEPYAGAIFGFTPGESTRLAAVQHQGVFIGMILVAIAAGGRAGPRFGSIRAWTVGGCVASGVVLFALALGGFMAPAWPLRPFVFGLGLANGAFAVAAIGWMMSLAGAGRESREGIRMGLWGGAQAVAFALGGFIGTVGVDVVRFLYGSVVVSYSAVFAAEGVLFLAAAILAARMEPARRTSQHVWATAPADAAAETAALLARQE